MKRVIITGGDGFNGSNLIERLLEIDSTEVACIDNFYGRKLKEFNIKDVINNTIKLFILIQTIKKTLDNKAIIDWKNKQQGDINITFINIDKAKRILNYYPATSFENGIQNFIEWYQTR